MIARMGMGTKQKNHGTVVAVAPERVRAFCAARQGMAGRLSGKSAAEIVARTGWLRSVGGCNPYLALRDRGALGREAVDRAVAKLEIQELPSARGCTYVVAAPDYALVSSLPTLVHPRRALGPLLDAEAAARAMPGGAKGAAGGTLLDLDYHAIVDRGRIVGLWDWDGKAGELVWKTFGAAPKGAKEAAAELATYVARDLGDVRSFSLDSPASRGKRLDALRKAKL
jgi:hypothetical protein